MRKGIQTALFVLLLLLVGNVAAQDIWNGTADIDWYNPSEAEYTITTAEQLAGLAELLNGTLSFVDKTVKLGADIMLNDTADWQNWATTAPANAWKPIGTSNSRYSFQGVFDGNGHVISGVYINNEYSYLGLFGTLSGNATIKNVGVVAFYIKGSEGVGGLVGASAGKIINSYSIGTVSGSSNNLGGLVGTNDGGIINNSYSTGTISSSGNLGIVGGLVGNNNTGTINNSYSTGSVNGNLCLGGLVGINGNNSIINNSYSTGAVNGNTDVGGLVGSNYGTVSNSYYNTQTSGQSDEGKGDGKTTAEMKTQATYIGWNFNEIWLISEDINNGYPHFIVDAPIENPVPISPKITGNNRLITPTNNGINLVTNNNITLSIYSLSGKQISLQKYAAGNYKVSLSHLPKGMYIVKASFGSGKQVMRVTVR